MDNALYVGLSRQIALRRELDIVANNIANADTTGFKVESLMNAAQPKAPAFTLGGPRPVTFVTPNGVARNFGQGAMRRTDSPLDVAIEGQGFFKVSAKGGERYTRDGRLKTDDTGRLTTQAGDPVLDEGGGEIQLNPENGPVRIAPDGTVSQRDQRVGKIGVFTFATLSVLEKAGGNLLQNTSNQQAQPAVDARLRQGVLEDSNVQPVLEITRMIELSRAYEQVSRMMDSTTELSRKAVDRLGRPN
jgi:flagellar basal-body rod protein FlgF